MYSAGETTAVTNRATGDVTVVRASVAITPITMPKIRGAM